MKERSEDREREEKQLNNRIKHPTRATWIRLDPLQCCAVLCEVQCLVASTLDVILRVG